MNIGNVFILGDSYSTFEGYIPAGYATYYNHAPREETDVCRVDHMWWHQLITQTGAHLLRNCSYSGTTVCNTGYDGSDCTDISFIGRLDRLIAEGYFQKNRVDTFFLLGGTNDSWANSPIGELMLADWKKEDLYAVLPAFGYLLRQISEYVPGAKVICVLNDDIKPEITDGFLAACAHYRVQTVVLHDIDKRSGHPTIAGMAQTKEQILAALDK